MFISRGRDKQLLISRNNMKTSLKIMKRINLFIQQVFIVISMYCSRFWRLMNR